LIFDVPPASARDTTAPTGSLTINGNAAYTNATAVTLTLSATDGVGVSGYYLSSSPAAPSAKATGWWAVTSTASYNGSAGYGGVPDTAGWPTSRLKTVSLSEGLRGDFS
jgi:hypothetical protein